MNLYKNENALRRTYLGMEILRDKLASEKTKIGKKIPRNQLRQNISFSAHENMPKGKTFRYEHLLKQLHEVWNKYAYKVK